MRVLAAAQLFYLWLLMAVALPHCLQVPPVLYSEQLVPHSHSSTFYHCKLFPFLAFMGQVPLSNTARPPKIMKRGPPMKIRKTFTHQSNILKLTQSLSCLVDLTCECWINGKKGEKKLSKPHCIYTWTSQGTPITTSSSARVIDA